jgi:hypothetical protein
LVMVAPTTPAKAPAAAARSTSNTRFQLGP